MSKWLWISALFSAVLWGAAGCGGKKCDKVTCEAGFTCDESDGVCKPDAVDGGGCSPACSGETPHCLNNACVQCVDSSQCNSSSAPICNQSTHTCGQIQVDAGDPGPFTCDPSLVVDLADAGLQEGLFIQYVGSVAGKRSDLEPPLGCQSAMGFGKGPEVVHRFNLPVRADVVVTTDNGTPLDTVLYDLATCSGVGKQTAPSSSTCNDDVDENSNVQSTLVLGNRDAGTQYLVVDSFNAAAAADSPDYLLSVSVRPLVGMGAGCDPNLVRNRCADGAACSVVGNMCEAGAAPTISSGSFFDASAGVIRIVINGADTNGDVLAYELEFLNASGNPITVGTASKFLQTITPSVRGKTSFQTSASLSIAGIAALNNATSIRVALRDGTGRTSAPSTFARGPLPAIASGNACKVTGATGDCTLPAFCKETAAGSEDGTCTTGTAPTLSSVAAFSGDAGVAGRVRVTGTDPEGDTTQVVVRYKQADAGFAAVADGGTFDTLNLSEYFVTGTNVNGVRALPLALTSAAVELEVALKDVTGLTSNALTVPITPVTQPGALAACDVRGWENVCISGAPVCFGASPTCQTFAGARGAACASAQVITPGTPVSLTLDPGADKWTGPCTGAGSSGGPEKVFKFDTTDERTDVIISTDYPETDVDTVLYTSLNCADQLNYSSCADDVDFENGKLKSRAVVRGLPAGTHYVFVDSWRQARQAGTGNVKLTVNKIPALTVAGTACDPLLEANYCSGTLHCRPDATYTNFTCQ